MPYITLKCQSSTTGLGGTILTENEIRIKCTPSVYETTPNIIQTFYIENCRINPACLTLQLHGKVSSLVEN